MAFVPLTPISTTSLLPAVAGSALSPRRPTAARPRPPTAQPCRVGAGVGSGGGAAVRRVVTAADVQSADAMEFFRHREGKWASWRVTHHLAFQRAESGESEIEMRVLDAEDERIVQLCKDWEVAPETAQGGCFVTWRATMAWDQEGENHEGSTVFALVPDADDVRRGRILRDRGYAEIVPIAGTYYLDENDALNLETPYEGGAVEEQFAFDGPDVVNRTSTVRRFGGLSTATFSTEQRLGVAQPDAAAQAELAGEDGDDDDGPLSDDDALRLLNELSLFGPAPTDTTDELSASSAFTGRPRWGNVGGGSTPSTSAFGSGFSAGGNGGADAGAAARDAPLPATSAFATGPPPPPGPPAAADADADDGTQVGEDVLAMAEKAGIDLSKVPPSMRADFLASLEGEAERKG